MAYDNSLTTSVQAHIRTVLAQKLMDANTTAKIGSTAREIREYLTDPDTLCTPDFTIRRYLQAHHPGLLADLGPLPDLVGSGKNAPWPADARKTLAARLAAASKEQGASITAAEWNRYLDKSGCSSREKVLRIAFTLKMDVNQTMELLLAFGMEPYSVRQPLDLICMFCQKLPGTYTWAQANQMYEEFLSRRTSHSVGSARTTAGMTEQVERDLNALFEKKLQGSNAQKALVEYMVEHSDEFISFLDGKEEVFLDGYTMQRADQYRRLTEYLAILYPSIITPVNKMLGEGDARSWDYMQWDNRIEYVADRDTGKISLPALARAMFWASGWTDLAWKEDAPKNSFDYAMHSFCKNYKQHIDKVNRLFSGGKNVAFFNRRDALLFLFFFISGCIKLYDYNDDHADRQIERLRELTERESRFDAAMGQMMDKLETLYDSDENAARYFQGLCQCFNMILSQMGHTNLYLPAQFDRFVLLALMSEDPEELASLIMSEAEWEEYSAPSPGLPGLKKG